MFRKLRADEIECRVQTVKADGVSLLLYKTARCDRAILDETVGAMSWQNDFKVIDSKMYGGIGIWHNDLEEWIWRWDCGTESNTEAEKGQASDSFKRAGFKWGIGVELYSSPRIWISGDGNSLKHKKYKVKEIYYDDNGDISGLVIVDDKGNTVYTMGKNTEKITHKTEEKGAVVDVSNTNLILDLRQSTTMKELLGVYNTNKTRIDNTPELKSVFKEVKNSIVSKM